MTADHSGTYTCSAGHNKVNQSVEVMVIMVKMVIMMVMVMASMEHGDGGNYDDNDIKGRVVGNDDIGDGHGIDNDYNDGDDDEFPGDCVALILIMIIMIMMMIMMIMKIMMMAIIRR